MQLPDTKFEMYKSLDFENSNGFRSEPPNTHLGTGPQACAPWVKWEPVKLKSNGYEILMEIPLPKTNKHNIYSVLGDVSTIWARNCA